MRFFNKFEEYAIIFLMLAITLIAFAGVVARTSGGNILWAKELTQNLFAWLVILGASYCVRDSAHIGIDAFVKRLKPGARSKVGLFAASVSVAFALILLIGGTTAFYEDFLLNTSMEDMPIKEWVFKLVMPIGFSLFLFRCSVVLWDIITGRQDSINFTDEAKEALENTE